MTTQKTMKPPVIYLNTKTIRWRDMDDVARATSGRPVLIKGTTLDLQGCTLSGSRLPHPENPNDEDSTPLRITIEGFTLRNGIVLDIPGGIIFRGARQTYRKLKFLRIGEDALSNIVDASPNSSVIECEFYGARDKSVQMNDGRGLVLESNHVEGGQTGVRIQESRTEFKNIKTKSVKGNTFKAVRDAWNISGGVIVKASDNQYFDVEKRWVANKGARYTEV